MGKTPCAFFSLKPFRSTTELDIISFVESTWLSSKLLKILFLVIYPKPLQVSSKVYFTRKSKKPLININFAIPPRVIFWVE
jgi:hypothetical protein